jgi:hypothetical protein
VKQVEGGYVYTVPVGLTLHCIRCPRDEGILRPGDQCFVEDDDSSSIYCLKHIPPPRKKKQMPREAMRPSVPRRRMSDGVRGG